MKQIYVKLKVEVIKNIVEYYNDKKDDINKKEVIRKYRDFFNVFMKYYKFCQSVHINDYNIPLYVIESCLKWCENMSVYDKLSKYGDFYYKIKEAYFNTRLNGDRVTVKMSYFDYRIIQEALKLYYGQELSHTAWVGKPRHEGYGAPLDYWYEGNKLTRQIQSTINHLKREVEE